MAFLLITTNSAATSLKQEIISEKKGKTWSSTLRGWREKTKIQTPLGKFDLGIGAIHIIIDSIIDSIFDIENSEKTEKNSPTNVGARQNQKRIAKAAAKVAVFSLFESLFQEEDDLKKYADKSLRLGLKHSRKAVANLVRVVTNDKQNRYAQFLVHNGGKIAIYAGIEALNQKTLDKAKIAWKVAENLTWDGVFDVIEAVNEIERAVEEASYGVVVKFSSDIIGKQPNVIPQATTLMYKL